MVNHPKALLLLYSKSGEKYSICWNADFPSGEAVFDSCKWCVGGEPFMQRSRKDIYTISGYECEIILNFEYLREGCNTLAY